MTETQLSKEEYEKRFKQRWDSQSPENFIGYGVNNPWTPPLMKPDTLLTTIDRHHVTFDHLG